MPLTVREPGNAQPDSSCSTEQLAVGIEPSEETARLVWPDAVEDVNADLLVGPVVDGAEAARTFSPLRARSAAQSLLHF